MESVVSDLKTFAQKGGKIAALKRFLQIFLKNLFPLHLNVFLPPLPKVFGILGKK